MICAFCEDVEALKREPSKHMSTKNTANYNKEFASPPDQKRHLTFEDLEVYQVRECKQGATLELREESPAYGLTEDQLDDLLADPGGPPASTLQRLTI